MNECQICGDTFRVELCVIDRPPEQAAIDRDRIEAYLCYHCRQERPHERIETGDA